MTRADPETVLVPAGEARLGDPAEPVHVAVFAVAPRLVSAAELAESGGEAGGAEPAAVTWADAVRYCRWLSLATGHTYRLPDEREWEKAARAGVLEGVAVVEWTNTWTGGARVLRGGGSLAARTTEAARAGFRVVRGMTGR